MPRLAENSPDSPCISRHPSSHHAGSSSLCNLLLHQTLPFSAQSPNGLLSSSHPPALDLPASEAVQPTLAGSCLTALSCGLPGCRGLPPAPCCVHPACGAGSSGTCLHLSWHHRGETGAASCCCLGPKVPACGQGEVGALREAYTFFWTSLHLTGLPLLAVHGQLVSVALKDLCCPTVMEKKIGKAVLSISTCFYLERHQRNCSPAASWIRG